MKKQIYDVVIIGAGVIGNVIAYELSKYDIDIAVLEKELDVGFGISSRNSGVIHSGIHYSPDTVKSKLNVRGNQLMGPLCEKLNVDYKYIGKLTIAANESEKKELYRLKEQGEVNGVPGLKILDNNKMQTLQPGINGRYGLYSPSTGILNPYKLTIALSENANINGVDYYFDSEVNSLSKENDFFRIRTNGDDWFKSKIVVNASGLYADTISKMLGIDKFSIYPCRGEYFVLDKKCSKNLAILIYPVPGHNSSGLGIHLTNTVDGNVLIGPSNEYIDLRTDTASTKEIMEKLRREGSSLLSGFDNSEIIRTFSGIRPKITSPKIGGFSDFTIENEETADGFINLYGIESPGLTSSPAIAERVRDLIKDLINLKKKSNHKNKEIKYKGMFRDLTIEKKLDLISENSLYGDIICRCEHVTKQEIKDAIESINGIVTLNGIKYRTRAMMGRCQGGFCLSKITEILCNEYNFSIDEIFLKSKRSVMYLDYLKRNK